MSGHFDPSIRDENVGYKLYITITVFTVAIVVTTTARLITKLLCKIKLGYDDYFIVLGTALNLVANGFDYKATASGFGRHAQFLSVDDEVDAVKYAQLAVGVANWAIWSVKISVCFFLLSIIRRTHKYFTWALYGLIAITTIAGFIGALLWGLQARPLAKLWDPRIPGTRASPEDFLVTVYVVYALGCFTDIFYAISPVYFLWGVRMSMRKKLPILAITGCGFLVLVVGFLNIAFARDFLDQEDITRGLVNEFICDITERNFSAFVANLPSLWLLVLQLRKKYAAYTESRRRRTGTEDTGTSATRRSKYTSMGTNRKRAEHRYASFGASRDDDESSGRSTDDLATLRKADVRTNDSADSRDPELGLAGDGNVRLRDMVPQRPERALTNQIRIDTEVQVEQGRRTGALKDRGLALGWVDPTL